MSKWYIEYKAYGKYSYMGGIEANSGNMVSTKNNNVFKKYLESIKWEFKYIADGEYNFGIGDFSFATPSLDPFNMKWEASALFSDGTILSFK